MAAAVADFAPVAAEGKIKKEGRERLELVLEPTADVVSGLAAARRPGQTIVGNGARAFQIKSGAVVTINGLTVSNTFGGVSSCGSAILNDGTLTLVNVEVTQNNNSSTDRTTLTGSEVAPNPPTPPAAGEPAPRTPSASSTSPTIRYGPSSTTAWASRGR